MPGLPHLSISDRYPESVCRCHQRSRAKQGVTNRMDKYVAIGMSHGPSFKRYFDAADHHLAAGMQAVKIVADSAANLGGGLRLYGRLAWLSEPRRSWR